MREVMMMMWYYDDWWWLICWLFIDLTFDGAFTTDGIYLWQTVQWWWLQLVMLLILLMMTFIIIVLWWLMMIGPKLLTPIDIPQWWYYKCVLQAFPLLFIIRWQWWWHLNDLCILTSKLILTIDCVLIIIRRGIWWWLMTWWAYSEVIIIVMYCFDIDQTMKLTYSQRLVIPADDIHWHYWSMMTGNWYLPTVDYYWYVWNWWYWYLLLTKLPSDDIDDHSSICYSPICVDIIQIF